MKKALNKISGVYHVVDGRRVQGTHENLRGDVTGLTGDVTGLTGNVAGLTGNVDECDLTPEQRQAGVDIADLVQEK